MTIYTDSVDVNQTWATRLAGFDELRNLTIAVNAPGNDVFDSHDVDAELAKRDAALTVFDSHLDEVRCEISENVTPTQSAGLLASLGTVQTAMDSMLAEADSIFTHFRNDEAEQAARRMATMDPKFADVSIQLAVVAEQMRLIQADRFCQQIASARDLRLFELLIGGFIVVIIGSVTVYGHKISKEMSRAAAQKVRDLAALEEKRVQLSRKIEEVGRSNENCEAAARELSVVAEARQRSEARLSGILEASTEAIVSVDEQGLIQLFNQGATATFGYAPDEVLGQTLEMLLPQRFREGHLTNILDFGASAVINRRMSQRGRLVALRKDGAEFPIEASISKIELDDELIFTVTAFDITDRVRAEEDLIAARNAAEAASEGLSDKNAALIHEIETREFAERERDAAESRLSDAIESVSEGFALWGPDDRLVLSNSKYLEMFRELSDILVVGVHFNDFIKAAVERGLYDTGGESVASFATRRLAEHRNPTEAFERHVSGERWVRISKRRTKSGGVVGIWTDITDRKRTEDEIRDLAMSDPLTGLANRNRFHAAFMRAVAEAERHDYRVALLVLDLDKFMNVNDELGHPVGDALLKEVADRLISVARETDTVARLGGDEFAIVMAHMGSVDAPAPFANRIIDQLSTPFELAGESIEIGASFGISIFPDDDTDVDELIRKAESALYRAKGEGRGNYQLYDAVIHSAALATKQIERELRLAIDRNEFILHYQPQLDIATRTITGVEALVRWRHPERGLLSPGEFISIAESIGHIVRIGRQVLQMACEETRRWQTDSRMPDLRVAVNISPRQFKSDNLVGLVEETLDRTGLVAEALELEITESTMMENIEQASHTLLSLKKLGVTIAIDDFGTGYSSLAYLKRFPVQRLKIDQSFVRGLTTDKDDAAIVQAMVDLGHSLRLGVIAEGVETNEQLDVLADLGCEEAQGYLFCRPSPPGEFAAWNRAQRKQTTSVPEIAPT